MKSEGVHISDQGLLLAVDGELSTRRAAEVQAHLASCRTCRTRLREIDSAIADFAQARTRLAPQLPSAERPRALLKLRMAELVDSARPKLWRRIAAVAFEPRLLALASAGSVIVLLGAFILRSRTAFDESGTNHIQYEARAIPDPSLTPGATLPVTRNDICAVGMTDTVRLVPAAVASQVFAAYGICEPKPRAYELDYLITPALGGSDNIRNFWPQPYSGTAWNAHIKDALEDHLYQMVCRGKLDLATAQRDISRDWISAYQKYFRTNKPLPEHSSFLKDRPWS